MKIESKLVKTPEVPRGVFQLKGFFSYFGMKLGKAHLYPAPKYDTIVEPFAGSAGYSIRYSNRKVILCDRSPIITGIWRFMIAATEDEILRLPDVPLDGDVREFDIPQEAKWLIGLFLDVGSSAVPRFTHRRIVRVGKEKPRWTRLRRERIANQLKFIRHWKVVEGDYRCLIQRNATWFVDPPYQAAGLGKLYGGFSDLNFAELGRWCRSLPGQVIVCDGNGADWLPFRPLKTFRRKQESGVARGDFEEMIWTKGC